MALGPSCPATCGILFPWAGIWAHVPCIARQIHNHWTTMDVSPGLICALFLCSCQAMGRPLPFMKLRFLWLKIANIMLKLTVFPSDSMVKNLPSNAGRCKRCRFDPWVETIPCSRKWQPTPIFLPGKYHEQRSLAGYSPWGHKELDMTEQLSFTQNFLFQCVSVILHFFLLLSYFLNWSYISPWIK